VAVGYIPTTKICGISKLARLVIKYASQPQLQENMTQQILKGLTDALDTEDVMVVVKARHLCMEMRGVKTQSPEMVTSAISGAFRRQEPRQEFMRLIE
jgi:GTP cyclohydrolase I